VIYVADATLTNPQVAFAIGRPCGTAVRRNRIRRQLRAHLGDLDRAARLPSGLYLVGLSASDAHHSGPQLRAFLDAALAKLPRTAP
jgi:ribonuclease P protein component